VLPVNLLVEDGGKNERMESSDNSTCSIQGFHMKQIYKMLLPLAILIHLKHSVSSSLVLISLHSLAKI